MEEIKNYQTEVETVIVDEEQDVKALTLLDALDNIPQIFTFIDMKDQKGKLLAAKAFSAPNITKKEMENKVFKLTNFLAVEVTIEGKNAARITLYDDKNNTAIFTSIGVLNTLKRFISIFGKPPWTPPIPIKLVEVNTRQGFRVYTLEPVIE